MENKYSIQALSTDSESLRAVAALLKVAFPNEVKYSPEFLQWQYRDNPDGSAIGFNAYCNGELVAHYACIPQCWIMNGKEYPALLSLNTATHPNHQGQGLFVKLANETYAKATNEKFAFIVGVANQNSFPGFIKKLGFKHFNTLDARIGFFKSNKNTSATFYRKITETNFKWRVERKELNYFQHQNCIYTKTAKSMIDGLLFANQNFSLEGINKQKPAILQLIIGNQQNLKQWKGMGINLPAFARPAPLHLIIKTLNAESESLPYESISFGLFDFDAY